jgi:hypothetical protein
LEILFFVLEFRNLKKYNYRKNGIIMIKTDLLSL